MTIGIYKLTFIDGSFYIGRSINIEQRYKDHCSTLKRTKSTCPKLQAKFISIGTLPILSIIEETNLENLSNKEVFWIKEYEAVIKGLNTLPGGEDILVGDKHPQSKYSNNQIIEVVTLLSSILPIYSHSEIELVTGVKTTTIKDIVCGKSHLWVKELHSDLYDLMMSAKVVRKSVNSLANLNPRANKRVEVYPIVTSPEGKDFVIEHLSNFAKEHGLQASNLSHVLSGRRLHHKGWKLKYASNN